MMLLNIKRPGIGAVLALFLLLAASPVFAQPEVDVVQPTYNAEFTELDDITITAEPTALEPAHLKVSNLFGGWRKLRIGYDAGSLWNPKQDVLAGGNDQLDVTLKLFEGIVDWADVQLRPQGSGGNPVNLQAYMAGAQDLGGGWFKLSIPLADFDPGIDFSQISFMEFPYAAGTSPFVMGVKEIVFDGGTTPFEWLGENKNDNSHDGGTGAGKMLAEFVESTLDNPAVEKVAFYANGILLGEDYTSPYEYVLSQPLPGSYDLTAVITDSLGATGVSEITPIYVNPFLAPSNIVITNPADGDVFAAPADIVIEAALTEGEQAHLYLTNPYGGWRKLKLGYDSASLYTPYHNAIADGNTHMEVTLKDFDGGIDWSKVEIRPQGNTNEPVKVGDYMGSATVNPDGWITFALPLADFHWSISFEWLTHIEIYYNTNDDGLRLGLADLRFTGATPFVWFGEGKIDNAHDGSTTGDNGSLTAVYRTSEGGSAQIVGVEFYEGGNLIGQDFTEPYGMLWQSVPEGSYDLAAVLLFDNGGTATSDSVTITVNPETGETPLLVEITSPEDGATFFSNESINVTAQVTDPYPTHFEVSNPSGGWRNFKLGYDAANLWGPQQNVTATGNNTMEVTLIDFNNSVDWSKIQIRPQGVSGSAVTVGGYLAGGALDWTTISIPLADFVGFNFSQISFVEFFSADAPLFSIGISHLEFTGGINPFLWFGDLKTDNSYAGDGSAGLLTANLNASSLSVANVEFFKDGVKVGEDSTFPYTIALTDCAPGTNQLTAVVTDSNGLMRTSEIVTITINDVGVPPAIQILTPVDSEEFVLGDLLSITTDVSVPYPAHYRISNPDGGYSAFKLGYDPANLYNPQQNVTATGNTTMEVALIDFSGTADWANLFIRPESDPANAVAIGDYIVGAGADWTTLAIPLADFAFDFTELSYLELFSSNAGPFEIGLDEIVFSGGVTPFLWFGDAKHDNATNPSGGPGNLTYAYLANTLQYNEVVLVEFLINGVKIGEDATHPFTFDYVLPEQGTFEITARATDANGLTTDSAPVTIIVGGSTDSTTVVITQPYDGQVFPEGQAIDYSASATPPNGVTIDSVEFYVDGVLLITALDPPYDVYWSSPDSGMHELVVWAYDSDGNVAVSDTITINVGGVGCPIVLDCPGNISQINDPGECGAAIGWAEPTAGDNCAGVLVERSDSTGLVNGGLFPVGTTTVEYTATDTAGNSAVCSFNVEVMDTVPPTVNCPSAIGPLPMDPGACGATAIWAEPAIMDNCPNVIMVQTDASGFLNGDLFPVGVTNIEYTAMDAAGNTTSCSFTVTVSGDVESPAISGCPNNIVELVVNTDVCGKVISWAEPTADDNCSGASIARSDSTGLNNGDLFSMGVHTISYTATDVAGNTAYCSFDIELSDGASPTIPDCPANIGPLDMDAGGNGATVTWVEPTANDNCSGASIARSDSTGLNSGDLFPEGVTTIEYTATDIMGNTASCSFAVTVNATPSPLTIAITSPDDGSAFLSNEEIVVVAEVNDPEPTHFAITNPTGGFATFKLGYDTANLWSPKQDVVSSGNTAMKLTLKDFGGTADWSKIYIRPQGAASAAVAIGDFISSAADWTVVSIPLWTFSGFDFTQISFVELFSSDAPDFNIGLAKVEFAGGVNPVLWFGNAKADNVFVGNGTPGQLLAELTASSLMAANVEFFKDGVKVGEDNTVPYTLTLSGCEPGTHSIVAVVTDGDGFSAESAPITINVDDAGLSPTIEIVKPLDGQVFTLGDYCLTSVEVSVPRAAHHHITNPDGGYRGFKLGFDPVNLYNPKQDVTVTGNDMLEITLIDFLGTADWANIYIRPQGNSTNSVAVADYLAGTPSTWTTLSIPMADFLYVDFTQLSYVEIFSTDAAPFEIGLRNLAFTGGSTPFVWFGETKFDNAVNGSGGVGELTHHYAPSTLQYNSIALVEFFVDGAKVGEDSSFPYSFEHVLTESGLFEVGARVTDVNGLTADAETVSVIVSASEAPDTTTVSLNAPTNGSVFVPINSVVMSATADAAYGTYIQKVEFYKGAVKIGEKLNEPYNFLWANPDTGQHKLVARAIDGTGYTAVSDTVNITVEPTPFQDAITVYVTFDSAPTNFNVRKSTLRFDKEFAYSFTLDDGKKDVVNNAGPFLSGGTVVGNGQTYPGLYYTDGCGNDQAFKGAIAWNCVNPSGDDLHDGSFPANMTWADLDNMYGQGWDVLNHSYSHKAKGWAPDGSPNPPLPLSVYNFEVNEAVSVTAANTANQIQMSHFVVPSGDDEYYDPALNNGMKCVYDQQWTLPGCNTGLEVDAPLGSGNDLLCRKSLSDNLATMTADIDAVAASAGPNSHWWWNDFTHSVGNFSGPAAGGIQFANFQQYMEHVEGNYGKSGADNIWMAPLQEVYEYLEVRDATVLDTTLMGNILEISIDLTGVPLDLRRYCLSLVAEGDANITDITVVGADGETHNLATGLINIEWSTGLPVSKVQIGADNGSTIEKEGESLDLFPNPVADVATLVLKNIGGEQVDVTIFDMNGRAFLAQTFWVDGKEVQHLSLDLEKSGLASGMYIARLETEQGVYSRKFLKK